MSTLETAGAAFVEMAHRIVWCSVATVDPQGRPRTRILHPIWGFEDGRLVGWVGTGRTPAKSADLAGNPHLACSYWAPNHDTCTADCTATWFDDDETCTALWERYKAAPAPLGYDPAMIPAWDAPTSPTFSALRLDPFRLRVYPGTLLLGQGGTLHTWKQ